MKIALLTDGIPPYIVGGMQQHSFNLAKELVFQGHSVDLFHCVSKEDPIPKSDEINNIAFKGEFSFNQVKCCKFPTSLYFPGHYLYNSFRYSNWIYKSIINEIDDFDFVYAKGFSAWKLLKSRKTFKVKIGIKFHGYEMYQYSPNLKISLQHFMLRPFVKWNNNKADFIFSYGSKVTDIINNLNVPRNKVIELPSAISRSWLREINQIKVNNKLRFLFIGRNERRKGINEIFDTLSTFNNDKSSFEFHFIGPIEEKDLSISSNIQLYFHGLVKDENKKKKIIDKSDILVCPSYSEGMPNVIIESMARGLAIIASDVGAVSLLVDSNNGILMDTVNSAMLKRSIQKMLKNKSKLLAMKKVSISRIEKEYTWDVIAEKFIKLIQQNLL
jgi:glycosyltransferase involved in cell wall biosynthesis